MKKNLNTERSKKIAIKRARHNLERKGHPFDINKPDNPLVQDKYKDQPKRRKKIPAPKIFSFISNPNRSIAFWDKSLQFIMKNRKIKQNFKNIQIITPDAILYMISQIEDMKHKKIKYSIEGNIPNNSEAKKLFLESGFLTHILDVPNPFENINKDLLTIRVGDKTEPKIAQEVVQSVRSWLHMDRIQTKPIYNILIECMANTHNHAYGTSTQNNHKWYLMAYYHNDEVHFVFLDNGYGIAETLRTNWKDVFSGKIFDDNKLLLSALQGIDDRTQTREKKRGRGLPRIYKHSKELNIKELVIVTNKGHINCKNDKRVSLSSDFKGTLLSWKIKLGEKNEKICN